MKKLILVLIVGCCFFNLTAQVIERDNGNSLYKADTTSFKGEVEIKLDGETKFTDYKVFSMANDTTFIDTTLSLRKYSKMNYLRKDDFELMSFHNMGQTFNNLGYNFQDNSVFPLIGVNAKQFGYQKVDAIKYYFVPTPTTEIMYRSALEQGQVLETMLTMNTSKKFNFSMGYKGLRSLGKYRYALASHGNFIGTFNYHNTNKTYYIKGHFSSFDFYNEENGGLTEASIGYFENSDPNYIDRGRLDSNINANNMYEGKRYFTDQSVSLFSKKNYEYRKIHPKVKDTTKASSRLAKKMLKKGIVIKKDSLLVSNPKVLDSLNIAKDSLLVVNPIAIDSLTQKSIVLKAIDSVKTKITDITKPIVTVKNDSLGAQKLVKKPIAIKTIDSVKTKSVDGIKPIIAVKNDSLGTQKLVKLDSISTPFMPDFINYELKLGHRFMYETAHYRFKQDTPSTIFGDAFASKIDDHTSYQKMNNEVYLQFDSPITGTLRAKGNQFNYNYHYNSILYYNDKTIADKLKGNALAVGADWNTTYGMFNLTADATTILSGDISGNSLKAATKFTLDSIFNFKGFAEITSKTPDFNKLLYQSTYTDYNWSNDFKNEELKIIGAEVVVNKWGSLKATYSKIDNYTYFNEESKPTQAGGTLEYFKAKANLYYTFRKFTIDNTIMYQKVVEGAEYLNVPQIVTRNSIYFTDYLFPKKPLFLQTGFTFKYFTKYNINAYNPLISEFVLQNDIEIGGFPMVDFFANAQIQRTRLYFKIENLTSSYTGRTYYSAPNYPYRDFTIRFGVVWNFFI